MNDNTFGYILLTMFFILMISLIVILTTENSRLTSKFEAMGFQGPYVEVLIKNQYIRDAIETDWNDGKDFAFQKYRELIIEHMNPEQLIRVEEADAKMMNNEILKPFYERLGELSIVEAKQR